MEFRDLTPTELEEAAALYMDTFNTEPWNDAWTRESAVARLGRILDTPKFFGLCLYEADALCGIVLGNEEVYYDGPEFWIKEFAVAQGHKGKGLGGAMMEELKVRLKARGVNRICLLTMPGKTERFYQHHGFDTKADNVIMKLTL